MDLSKQKLLTPKELDEIVDYVKRPNKELLECLKSLVFEADGKTFKLKRLNKDIKPNTMNKISAAVRQYSKKVIEVYGDSKSSIWHKLSSKEVLFKDSIEITRPMIIALCFVFRLTVIDANNLLNSAGYYGLYARSIEDSIINYTLSMYLKSDSFKSFNEEKDVIDSEKYIENYTLFLSIIRDKRITISLDFLERAKRCFIDPEASIKKEVIPSKSGKERNTTDNLIIYRDPLEDFILNSAKIPENQTKVCNERLKNTIQLTDYQYAKENFYSLYLNVNKERFALNRERSLRYLYMMLYRYILTPTIHANADKSRKNLSPKLLDRINMGYFFSYFTEFINQFNLFSPAEITIQNYFSIKPGDIAKLEIKREFIPSEDSSGINDADELKQRKNKAFVAMIREILSACPGACNEIGNGQNFSSDEKKKIINILNSKGSRKNRSSEFREILLGSKDINRELFILVYLFTSMSQNDYTINIEKLSDLNIGKGSFEELNMWLSDCGFKSLVNDPLEEFVNYFFMFNYSDSFNRETHDIVYSEKLKASAVNKYFSQILLDYPTINLFERLRQSATLLSDETKALLP